MDEILTDSHFDTAVGLFNVIVPKVDCAEVWEGNTKFAKQLETAQTTVAKQVLGCSNTTSDTVLRVELGLCPLKYK